MEKLQDKILEAEFAVPAAYLLFLLFAFLSFKIPVTRRYLIDSFSAPPSVEAYLLSLFGIAAFMLSVRIGKRMEVKAGSPLLLGVFVTTSAVVYLTLNIHILLAILAGSGYAALLFFLSSQQDFKKLTNLVFFLGLLSAFTILIHGIPLLSATAREAAAVSPSRALFHGFGVFAAALLVGFYDRKKAATAVLVLAIAGLLSGFKSDAIAIIVSASIAGLLLKRITIRAAVAAVLAVGLILTGVSTFIALIAYGTWNIPPYLYPFYRFGFTFSVFSRIADLALPFGLLKGQAILNTTQEIVSTAVLGYHEPHIITSTLFGPLTLDFGILGTLLTAVLIGLYFGAMKRNTTLQTCLYAMGLTHVLVLIEVGLQLSSVMFLLSMLYLSISEKL
ncbi:MAG: hypothetical protein ACE5HH_01110 [Candidatus Hydrothermarchaeales archaeon]